jgi:hypothetical protein
MPRLSNVEQANRVRAKVERRNDYFTPKTLVKIHLGLIAPYVRPSDIILEPSSGKNAYLDEIPREFPECRVQWCEIALGRDFFLYEGQPDIVIGNPPFSLLNKFFERTIELRPRIISFLLNAYAVTPCRIREFNDKGYFVVGFHLTRVNRWFGVSVIVVLSREATENLRGFGFDCKNHVLEISTEPPESTQQIVL